MAQFLPEHREHRRDGPHERGIATDGTATLQQMIESVKVEISSPMAKVSCDSAAAAPAGGTQAMHFIDASLRGMYAAMIGEPVTLVLATGTLRLTLSVV